MDVLALFNNVLGNILSDYPTHRFMLERDFVWTVQKGLSDVIDKEKYAVFNDYPIERSRGNRALSVDLAVIEKETRHEQVLDREKRVELAVEFKFEPSKKRIDICRHKLPVVFWNGVENDVKRVERFTQENRAGTGIALFLDENGRYRNKGNKDKWTHHGSLGTDFLDIWIYTNVFCSKAAKYIEGDLSNG